MYFSLLFSRPETKVKEEVKVETSDDRAADNEVSATTSQGQGQGESVRT